MRKVEDGEKKGHEKIVLFTVATNIVTSRPLNADRRERRQLIPKNSPLVSIHWKIFSFLSGPKDNAVDMTELIYSIFG